jgi:hypothetical protein
MRKRVVAAAAQLILWGLAAGWCTPGTPGWAGSVSTPFSAVVVSADGTTVTPPTGNSADGSVVTPSVGAAKPAAVPAASQIVTTEGTWTFGAPPNSNGDYPILLNGSNANGGWAAKLMVTNGHLYAVNKNPHYWVRSNSAWLDANAAAPVEGTVATKVTLSPTGTIKVPDNAAAGAVVATVNVTMSPAAATFTGPLVSSNPLFVANGANVVLSRALKASDDGPPFNVVITAVQ